MHLILLSLCPPRVHSVVRASRRSYVAGVATVSLRVFTKCPSVKLLEIVFACTQFVETVLTYWKNIEKLLIFFGFNIVILSYCYYYFSVIPSKVLPFSGTG